MKTIIKLILVISVLTSCQKEELLETTYLGIDTVLSVNELDLREIHVEYTDNGISSYIVKEFHEASEEVLDFSDCMRCIQEEGWGFFGLTEEEIDIETNRMLKRFYDNKLRNK
ncbi:hypothetical protein [uncultured Mediterranean phage uvMED]|nr:hypothetical protein [uncultured Mediterranean phage uvMED]